MINISVDEKTQEAINAKITAQQAAETQEINNQTAINKAKADAEVTKAEAQAKAEARNKFGWVTISGTNNTVVTDK